MNTKLCLYIRFYIHIYVVLVKQGAHTIVTYRAVEMTAVINTIISHRKTQI